MARYAGAGPGKQVFFLLNKIGKYADFGKRYVTACLQGAGWQRAGYFSATM
jgi:hypothetical protein